MYIYVHVSMHLLYIVSHVHVCMYMYVHDLIIIKMLAQGRYFSKKKTASGGIQTHDRPLARRRSYMYVS